MVQAKVLDQIDINPVKITRICSVNHTSSNQIFMLCGYYLNSGKLLFMVFSGDLFEFILNR